jgi:thiamine transport system ATP-binding protein
VLTVEDLGVRYGDTVAVADVSLTVPDGAITAIIGPSGSGKTSLLRGVAGLEPLATGRVRWDDEDLTDHPPHRRDFGLMFQDHALFAHLDVAANVRFGLRMRRAPAAEQRVRIAEMLDLVGLGDFGGRRVDALSGGEQQRVALARALAPRPRLLMLDEPLASVDRERRAQLAVELHRVIRTTGTATLLVTHDLDEAFTLADHVVLLAEGRIVQTGAAAEVWRAPASVEAARFLGVATERTVGVTDGRAATPWGPVATCVETTTAWVGWRPTDLTVQASGAVAGTVRATWVRGDHVLVEVATPDGGVTARAAEAVTVGAPVRVAAELDATVILPA